MLNKLKPLNENLQVKFCDIGKGINLVLQKDVNKGSNKSKNNFWPVLCVKH